MDNRPEYEVGDWVWMYDDDDRSTLSGRGGYVLKPSEDLLSL